MLRIRTMKVVLKESIEKLGKRGDIVEVAAGYGRNYLIPRKMALEVTASNMKMIELEQKALKKKLEKEVVSYREIAEKLNQTSLSFERKAGDKDVIFGSVSLADIKEALDKLGFEIEKKKIILEEPIKRLGNYAVPIKIFHEEKAEVKIEVKKEGEKKAPEEKERTPEEKPGEEQEASKEESVPDEEAVETGRGEETETKPEGVKEEKKKEIKTKD
jgi:large subunit ribosomal protein L9